MKRIVFLLILPLFLLASNINYELKIYDALLSNIFPNKKSIYVWSDSKKREKILSKLKDIKLVSNQNNADILIINNTKNIISNKLKFATSYKMLKYYKNDAIGGFYWKKGRPNILFLKQNLIKHDISLPNSFNDYIEDSL